LLVLVALLVILLVGYLARTVKDSDGGAQRSTRSTAATIGPQEYRGAAIAYSQLPPQARHTIELIRAGGPFPYDRDGIVFGNAEGHLPAQRSGYYHEYTVVTPGESDRGARRIIAGAEGEFYYTADHYETFRAVDLDR
jgi:ribonuclease T1